MLVADPEPARRDAVVHALGRKALVVHATSTLEGAMEAAAASDLWLFSSALGVPRSPSGEWSCALTRGWPARRCW